VVYETHPIHIHVEYDPKENQTSGPGIHSTV
jgi:hypothetical protein